MGFNVRACQTVKAGVFLKERNCFSLGDYHRGFEAEPEYLINIAREIGNAGYAGLIILNSDGVVIDGWRRLILLSLGLDGVGAEFQGIGRWYSDYRAGYRVDDLYEEVIEATKGIDFKDVVMTCVQITGKDPCVYKGANLNNLGELDRMLLDGVIQHRDDCKKVAENVGSDLGAFLETYPKGADPVRYSGYYHMYQGTDLYRLGAGYLLEVFYQMAEDYGRRNMSAEEFDKCLAMLEDYEIRRQVYELPKVDVQYNLRDMPGVLREIGYPNCEDFLKKLGTSDLYNISGALTSVVLNRLEKKNGVTDNLVGMTIEHIMPQTPRGNWTKIPKEEYDRYLHTLGNLTLTGYNSQLSNKDFNEKVKLYEPLWLNIELLTGDTWTPYTIKRRAERLKAGYRGLCILEDYEHKDTEETQEESLIPAKQGTAFALGVVKPVGLSLVGYSYGDCYQECKIWLCAITGILTKIIEENPLKVREFVKGGSKFIAFNADELRKPRDVGHGYYIEGGLGAGVLCVKIKEIVDFCEIDPGRIIFYVKDSIPVVDRVSGFYYNGLTYENENWAEIEENVYNVMVKDYTLAVYQYMRENPGIYRESPRGLSRPKYFEDLGVYYDTDVTPLKKYKRVQGLIDFLCLDSKDFYFMEESNGSM